MLFFLISNLIMYLVFVVEVEFLCVGSPHMVLEKTFSENCCTKAEFASLKLQEQPLFDLSESFKELGELN